LAARLKKFSDTYDVQVYLEPGEAAVTDTATLEVQVLDIVENGGKQLAIVDASIEAHMLDLLTYQLPARIAMTDASKSAPEAPPHTYTVCGNSCLNAATPSTPPPTSARPGACLQSGRIGRSVPLKARCGTGPPGRWRGRRAGIGRGGGASGMFPGCWRILTGAMRVWALRRAGGQTGDCPIFGKRERLSCVLHNAANKGTELE